MVPASRAARLVRRLPRFLRVPTRAAGALIGGLVALLLELAALPGRAIDALTAPMVDGIEIPPCPGCDSPLCPDCRYASDLWW